MGTQRHSPCLSSVTSTTWSSVGVLYRITIYTPFTDYIHEQTLWYGSNRDPEVVSSRHISVKKPDVLGVNF